MDLYDVTLPSWFKYAISVAILAVVFMAGVSVGGFVSDKQNADHISKAEIALAHSEKIMAELQSAVDRAAAQQAERVAHVVIKQAEITGSQDRDIQKRRADLRNVLLGDGMRNTATAASGCRDMPADASTSAIIDASAVEPATDTARIEAAAAQDALTVLEWQDWYRQVRDAENGNP
jgi:hypothetical protein